MSKYVAPNVFSILATVLHVSQLRNDLHAHQNTMKVKMVQLVQARLPTRAQRVGHWGRGVSQWPAIHVGGKILKGQADGRNNEGILNFKHLNTKFT